MMFLLQFGPLKGIEGRIRVSISFCERLMFGIGNTVRQRYLPMYKALKVKLPRKVQW